jgi:hypothetical protein
MTAKQAIKKWESSRGKGFLLTFDKTEQEKNARHMQLLLQGKEIAGKNEYDDRLGAICEELFEITDNLNSVKKYYGIN